MTGPLGQRQFRALLAGRAISMLGSAIAPVAIAFAVLDLTGSAAALGLVLAARSIPEVVFMLVGGVIADRFDRARVLVAANVVASGTQGIGTTLLLTGAASVPALANSRSDQRVGSPAWPASSATFATVGERCRAGPGCGQWSWRSGSPTLPRPRRGTLRSSRTDHSALRAGELSSQRKRPAWSPAGF
jgi:MFS family permease